MRRGRFPVPAAALAAAVALLALTGGAGAQSVFGLNFIGEHLQRGCARYTALGFSAVAAADTNNVVTQNPSSTADLRTVTFTIHQSIGVSRIHYEEQSSRQTRYLLPSILFAAPLRPGLVFSGGYVTRSAGRADFAYPLEVDGAPSGMESYRHDASLFYIPVTLAWKPVGMLNVAAEVRFDRGSITDRVIVSFDNSAYREVESKRRRNFNGTSWGASMLLRVHPRVRIGAALDAPVSYSVDETIEHTESTLDSESSFEFELPVAWSAGVAVNVYERWWLTSSFWMRSAPEPSGFEWLEGSLGDETHFGLGVERLLGTGGGFFEWIPLRVGFSMDRWHLEFPAGSPVRATFFSLGSAFPLPGGPGSVDITAEFGRIGSLQDNGIDEDMFRLSISLSVSEPWSRRRTVRH